MLNEKIRHNSGLDNKYETVPSSWFKLSYHEDWKQTEVVNWLCSKLIKSPI